MQEELVSFKSHVSIGDRVSVDSHDDFKAIVTALCFRMEYYEVEVSYTHNGSIVNVWIASWRVNPIE